MARTCTICTHPDATAIDRALVSGAGYRDIAGQFAVSKSAVERHAAGHLPAALVRARDAGEIAAADDLLAEIRSLHSRTLSVLTAAEATRQHRTALAAIGEARRNVELLARLLGELDDRPQVNILIAPEWLEIRAVIVSALEAHPDALTAVVGALERVPDGRA